MLEFPMPKLEEIIVGQIVQKFFDPVLVGYELGHMPGSFHHGSPVLGPVPKYGLSPLVQVAQQMYQQHAEQLSKLIWEKINVDELVEAVAKECIEKRFSTQESYGRRDSQVMRDINDRVDKRVEDELYRRRVAQIDAQLREEELARKAKAEGTATE